MNRVLISVIIASSLIGGCITNNYYCKCRDKCNCTPSESVIQQCEPIVAPDTIDDTKQEDGAPQYPNIKPWYKN